MTEELLPCPFCGVEPYWKRWEINDIWQIKIFCDGPDCHVYPSIFGNEQTMTRIWNTRAQPKYKLVDLGLKRESVPIDYKDGSHREWEIHNAAFNDGWNEAIDDIKSKYGDLFIEIKE